MVLSDHPKSAPFFTPLFTLSLHHWKFGIFEEPMLSAIIFALVGRAAVRWLRSPDSRVTWSEPLSAIGMTMNFSQPPTEFLLHLIALSSLEQYLESFPPFKAILPP